MDTLAEGAFAGRGAVLAEKEGRGVWGMPSLDLQAGSGPARGAEAKQEAGMGNQTKPTANEAGARAAKTGRGLLWAGSAVLMGEAAFLMTQISAMWESSGARTLGWVAAAGATLQHIMALLTWNDGLLLAAAAKVLVLCCPLLAIAVGMGMMRKAQYAEESDAASAKAEEERR